MKVYSYIYWEEGDDPKVYELLTADKAKAQAYVDKFNKELLDSCAIDGYALKDYELFQLVEMDVADVDT